jgi:branched-chain amino acid transport system substrate-binding protein
MKRYPVWTAVLGLTVLVSAGCGSRQSDSALKASDGAKPAASVDAGTASNGAGTAAPTTDASPVPASDSGSATPGTSSAASPAGATGSTAAPSRSGASAGSAAAAASGGASSAGNQTGAKASPGSATAAGKAGGGSAGGGTAGGGTAGGGSAAAPKPGAPMPGAPTPAAPSTANNGKPIVIGSIGTNSGPAGAPIKTFAEGVQIWVKAINAKGGINGHAVKQIIADDGGDPARTQALYQDLVENKGVIAFVANGDCFGGQTAVGYVNKKRVPVVGGIACGDWFYDSPMYFPYAPEGIMNWSSMVAAMAQRWIPKGLTKFGSMTCAEAVTCRAADKLWHDQGRAKEVGFDAVYRGQISIAQPDYTAECLSAQRAGAQVIAIASDSASMHRIAAACARQSYHPMFAWPYSAHLASDKDDPNVEGGMAVAGWFPEVKGDTPATAEFQDAFAKFFGGAPAGGHSGGWAAGKMFELAASRSADPTTSAGILEGLWTSFHGDTLGGLTMPLTFVREKPSPKVNCAAPLVVEKAKYVLPTNGDVKCQ